MPSLVRHLLSQPPLEAEREQALARAARSGDRAARDLLVTESLRLVALRARSLGLVGDGLDEAVQSGTVGLIAAVDRFDPDRGSRLATYAWPWITSAILVPYGRETPSETIEPEAFESAADPSDDIAQALVHLPSRVAAVIRLRYRIGEPGGPPRTRRDVAAQLGLTVGQVRSDEARAMRHLRHRLARVCDRAPRSSTDGRADPL